MKNTELLQPVMGLTVLMVLLSACANLRSDFESPNVSLAALWVKDMNFFEQRYGLKLRVQNPNDFDLHVRGISYDVTLNGNEFATGVSPRPVTVAAYDESVIEVDMVSNLLNIVTQIRSLHETPTLRYSLSGKLSLDNILFKVPFEYQGELTLPGNSTGPGADIWIDPQR